MNIFEQYGIKEVADVTFYAITLNKYGEEIYVPVIYFDTLKISNLDQTASQTSAKGGRGNSELVTWDFGKEIKLSLEDALYTPASQSMMWGGKFGIEKAKIYGVWNPIVYPKDRHGNSIYLKKLTAERIPNVLAYVIKDENGNIIKNEVSEEELIENGFHKVVCICDEKEKYIKNIPNDDCSYKYLRSDIEDLSKLDDQLIPVNALCPREKIIYENQSSTPIKRYSTTYNSSSSPQENLQLENKKWINNKRPEIAQVIIDNYNTFDYKNYIFVPKNEEECYYQETTICGPIKQGCVNKVNAYGYIWKDSELKMTSLEGDQDIYFLDNADVRYRLSPNNSNKEVMISRKGIYKKNIENLNKEILNYNTNDLIYGENSLIIKEQGFDSKVDFYRTINWKIVNSFGKETKYVTKVKVGTFYIMEDLNLSYTTPFDMIHPINDGMKNTKVIDRMEKIVAKKTFAIDVDANLAMFEYFNIKKYSNSNLQSFLDPRTMKPFEANAEHFNLKNGDILKGNLHIVKEGQTYYKQTRTIAPKYSSLGKTIIVDAINFPGAFKVVGETRARSREDQKDQRFQFEIPLCKLSPETSLQLQADGDPTTFKMDLKVLRKSDGTMIKLTQYSVEEDTLGGTRITAIDSLDKEEPTLDKQKTYWKKISETVSGDSYIRIENPEDNEKYHLELDLLDPYYKVEPFVESVNQMDNLDRSKIVVTEKQDIEEKTIFVEYMDEKMEIPTNNMVETIDNKYTTSKVLNPDEYNFEIKDMDEEGI